MLTKKPIKLPGASVSWRPGVAPDVVAKARHGASMIAKRNLRVTEYSDEAVDDAGQISKLSAASDAATHRHRAELLAIEAAEKILRTRAPDLASDDPLVRAVSDLVIRADAFAKAAGDDTVAADLADVEELVTETGDMMRKTTKTILDRLPKARAALSKASLAVASRSKNIAALAEDDGFLGVADPLVRKTLSGRTFGEVVSDGEAAWLPIDHPDRNAKIASKKFRAAVERDLK